MSSEEPDPYNYEQRAIENAKRRMANLLSIFPEGMELVPLLDALKKAEVHRSEEIASLCQERAAKYDVKQRSGLSYVFSYIFLFGADGTYSQNPCFKINLALLNGSPLSLMSVRGLIWGLLCGLSSLPFRQFKTLYRGLKTHAEWEEGNVKLWPCFTSTTMELNAAKTFLKTLENGEQEGTLVTIEEGWGYDLSELSVKEDEHEVILEPGIQVRVKSFTSGIIIKAVVTVVSEEKRPFSKSLFQRKEDGKDKADDSEEKSDKIRKEQECFQKVVRLKRIGDYEEAAKSLEALYKDGSVKGKIEYAIILIMGNFSSEKRNIGFNLLQECEKHDDGRVFYELGVCYQMGYGVVVDKTKSQSYFLKSLLCGYPPSVLKCYELEKAKIKPSVFVENKARYDEVKKKSSQGDALCLGIRGCCLLHGLFEEKNLTKGYELVNESAEKRSPFGQNCLGDCFMYGWGTVRDSKKGFECYKHSAGQDDPDGQRNLAICYLKGKGVSQDNLLAVDWFKKSIEQDHPGSQFMLGMCYLDGKGVAQSRDEAKTWIKQSADQGNAEAKEAYESNWGGICSIQ